MKTTIERTGKHQQQHINYNYYNCKTVPFDGKVLILSEAGKPIFYSGGNEEEICGVFGVISVIVQRYHRLVHDNESGKDSLLSIQTPTQYFQFLYRSPLILCLISNQPWNLAVQLDTIYNQIISIFSRQMLKQYYQRRGSNFDIRFLFDGIDKRVEACMKGFNEDPVILYGFRILPLNPGDRDFLVETMGNIINELCPNIVAFGLLIAHRQLVTLVRRKKLTLDAPDFNTIVNLIECHKANLVQGDHQLPFCLPKLDPNQFLYAYISYLWDGDGPCMLLLTTSNSASTQLSHVRPRLEESLCAYKRYEQLRAELLNPEGFTLRENNSRDKIDPLWYFMYKNISTSLDPTQVCCSTPKKPFISFEELVILYNGYTRLADLLRRSGGAIKMVYQIEKRYSLLAWITSSFELYCTFNPLTKQKEAMDHAEHLLRVLRKEEKRVLFSSNPVRLATVRKLI